MSKALMISIRPEHAVNILNGKKTLELRAWISKDYVGWVYVYVTKKKPYLTEVVIDEYFNTDYELFNIPSFGDADLNGKVVARFWFDEYEELSFIKCWNSTEDYDLSYTLNGATNIDYLLKDLCVDYEHLEEYGQGKPLYAWHIKKLEVFDEPKHLSDFKVLYGGEESLYPLKKAPQRSVWIYVEDRE